MPGARPVRVRVDFGALTHVGKVRPNNEDQYLIARLSKSLDVLASSLPGDDHARLLGPHGYLMLVADGMGGRGGGEIASARVVQAAKRHVLQTAKWFFRFGDENEEQRVHDLREALARIDRELVEAAEDEPALAGMGTTLTAASSIGEEVFIVHVGDSRAYLFRRGELDQLTRDHTMAQGLIDAGLIDPEEARSHRLRNVLTNCVGGHLGVKGEITKLRIADGDRLLLCTDGLNDAVSDTRIAELLSRHNNPAVASAALVDAALDGGGRDNITALVAAYSVADA
jgi:protein phosphatase